MKKTSHQRRKPQAIAPALPVDPSIDGPVEDEDPRLAALDEWDLSSKICYSRSVHPELRDGRCRGVLVGGALVLTCAHCVTFDKSSGSLAREYENVIQPARILGKEF